VKRGEEENEEEVDDPLSIKEEVDDPLSITNETEFELGFVKEELLEVKLECPEDEEEGQGKSVIGGNSSNQGMKESEDSKTVKPCIQCDYVTSSAIGLKRHIESKHEGIQYFCEQCNYVSSEKGNLKKHILNKHEGIRYYCDLCDYSATRSNILKKHVDSKHPGYLSTKSKAPHEVILYPCDQSDSFATGSDNLDLRIASQNEEELTETGKLEIREEEGQESTETVESVMVYVKEELLEVKIECPEDQGVTVEEGCAISPLQAAQKAQYQCDKCVFISWKPSYLKQHIAAKHEGIRYPCDQCKGVFTSYGNLGKHKKTKHNGEKSKSSEAEGEVGEGSIGNNAGDGSKSSEADTIDCDLCPFAAVTPWSIKAHKMKEHDIEAFFCYSCVGFVADTNEEKIEHIKEKHPHLKCNKCEYVAAVIGNLKEHFSKNHLERLDVSTVYRVPFTLDKAGKKRYQCDECDHSSSRSDSLRIHKDSKHKGIRYPCDDCDYDAAHLSSLSKHKKQKHN